MKTAALLILTAGLVTAQPAFRTAARLIEVNVVVTDKSGKSVEWLTQGDFEITDNEQLGDGRDVSAN